MASFNVRNGDADDGPDHWEQRKGQLAQLIRDLDPDILGLQEPFGYQMDFIGSHLQEHRRLGCGRDDGDANGEYCGLFVREPKLTVEDSGTYWFSDTPDIPGSMSWGNRIPRCCTWARVQWGGLAFSVHNVHLDHESQGSRFKSVELLMSRLDGDVLIMGDFNAEPNSPEIRQIRFPNVFEESSDRDAGTWHAFTGLPECGPIDYIFASPLFTVRRAWLDRRSMAGRYPSDHFALVADLDVRPTNDS